MKFMKDIAEVFAVKSNNRYVVGGYETCGKCGYEYPTIIDHEKYMEVGAEKAIVSNNCPRCLVDEENNEFRIKAKKELKKREVYKYDRFSIIPHDLKGATLENYQPYNVTQQNALKYSTMFAKGELEKTTIFFQGDTGIGKTHLAFSVYKKHKKDLKTSLFIDVPGLMNMIRNTYNNEGTTQDQIMETINNVELLVLDDIGAEYVKPDANGYESWAADILFQIANARQGKKNIYTTNFTAKHLTRKYGMMSKRIISRLMSNAKIIKVEGDDHRLKGLD